MENELNSKIKFKLLAMKIRNWNAELKTGNEIMFIFVLPNCLLHRKKLIGCEIQQTLN